MNRSFFQKPEATYYFEASEGNQYNFEEGHPVVLLKVQKKLNQYLSKHN
jgi:hypothetical protein